MKVALIGGHLSPALAVIDALPKQTELVFFGRKYVFEADKTVSLEYKTITDRGIRFIPITTGRFQRKLSRQSLFSLAKLPVGFLQAHKLLRKEKPDVVVGFGGYVSVPIILAAAFQGIPTVLHEQTLRAGLANKLLARFVTRICISWESSKRFFPTEKTVLTGNPVRKEIVAVENGKWKLKNEKDELPFIYITGGSAGAHAINELVFGCLPELAKKYHVFLQTGDAQEFGDFAKLEKAKTGLPQVLQRHIEIQKFVSPEQVGEYLARASLVVGRSGMNTVTELLYLQKPCLLIPLPHGQQHEQLDNARMLETIGLASVYEQHSLTPTKLLDAIDIMVQQLSEYRVKNSIYVQKESGEHLVSVITETAAA